MAASRPIVTHYAGGPRIASSTTPKKAISAASRKLVGGVYARATIEDQAGRVLAEVTKDSAYSITIFTFTSWGRMK